MKPFFFLLALIVITCGCNTIKSQIEDNRTASKIKKAAVAIRLEEAGQGLTSYQTFRVKQKALFDLESDPDFLIRAVQRMVKEETGEPMTDEQTAEIRRKAQYAIDHPTYEIRTWHY